MDEATLRAILAPMIETMTNDLRTFVHETVQPLQEQVSALATPAAEVPETDDAIARIQRLEADLAAQNQRNQELEFDRELQGLVPPDCLYRQQVLQHLKTTVQPGPGLAKQVEEFFKSDYGRHHLKATEGLGTQQPPAGTKEAEVPLADQLLQAFS